MSSACSSYCPILAETIHYSATVKRQADVRGYNGQRVKKEINLINSHNEGTAK
jgi:hypothetical protein